MLFVEKELNCIIFNSVDFKPKKNYMPDLVLAFRDLDPNKTIHFALDMKQAPLMFILYFRKLMQAMPHLKLELYFADKSELLPGVMENYKLKYKNISQFPWELPSNNNVKSIVDPYKDIEGIDDLALRARLEAQAAPNQDQPNDLDKTEQ